MGCSITNTSNNHNYQVTPWSNIIEILKEEPEFVEEKHPLKMLDDVNDTQILKRNDEDSLMKSKFSDQDSVMKGNHSDTTLEPRASMQLINVNNQAPSGGICGFKEDKNELLKSFEHILRDNTSTCANKFKFVVQRVFNISKQDYNETEFTKTQNISVINAEYGNNWMKPPWLNIKKLLCNVSILEKFNRIYFDTFVHEYERFPIGKKYSFISYNLLDNTTMVNAIDFKEIATKFIILIFDDKSVDSLNLLQLLISVKQEQKFELFPIYGKDIHSDQEPLIIAEQISNNLINLGSQEWYFTTEAQNNPIKKWFNYIKNDNKHTIIPLCVYVDSNKIIRKICDPSEFSVGFISNKELDKSSYKSIIKSLRKELGAAHEPCNISKWNMKKCEIYAYNETSQKISLEHTYYEPLNGIVKFNGNVWTIINDIIKYKTINMLSDTINTEMRIKAIGDAIHKEIDNFSKVIGVEMTYEYMYRTKYNIWTLSNTTPEKYLNEASVDVGVEIQIDNDLFEQKFHLAIASSLGALYDYSNIAKISYISCLPKSKGSFIKSITLLNTGNNSEEELQFSYWDKPSIVVIIPNTMNYWSTQEIIYKLRKIVPMITTGDLNTVIIYKGEKDEFGKFYKILRESDFILDLPIYLCDSSIESFPIYFDNYYWINQEKDLLFIITDSRNQVVYTGNFNDINKKNFIYDLFNADIQAISHYHNRINAEELQRILKQFEELVQWEFDKMYSKERLLYRPYISISYDKRIIKKNEIIENVAIKVIIKERHSPLFTQSKPIKMILNKLRKEYNASIIVLPIQCLTLNIPINCSKCKSELKDNEPFYLNQNKNKIYCLHCESQVELQDTNCIYFNSLEFDNEIIEEFYNWNVNVNVNVNVNAGVDSYKCISEVCDLCKGIIKGVVYTSLTHFSNLNGYNMICICKQCFNLLSCKNEIILSSSSVIKNAWKYYMIYQDHLIFRKIKME